MHTAHCTARFTCAIQPRVLQDMVPSICLNTIGVVEPVLDKLFCATLFTHPKPVASAGTAEKGEWTRQLMHQRTLLTTQLKKLVTTHSGDPRGFLRSAPK